jgi:hypothetical protein
MRNEFAVGVGDALGPVDANSQDPAASGAEQLDVDDFNTLRAAHALGDFGDLGDDFYFVRNHLFIAIKKWAFAHLA